MHTDLHPAIDHAFDDRRIGCGHEELDAFARLFLQLVEQRLVDIQFLRGLFRRDDGEDQRRRILALLRDRCRARIGDDGSDRGETCD